MNDIRAFVAHSFSESDADVVRKFTNYLRQLSGALPNFTWITAEPAEPRQLAEKVKALFEDRNLLIGICTRREYVVEGKNIDQKADGDELVIRQSELRVKTADWLIQEIGYAIGKNLNLILFLEAGVDKPGGLQGDIEYIPFERSAPEKSFGKLLEMITAVSSHSATGSPTPSTGIAPTVSEDMEIASPQEEQQDIFTSPQEDWSLSQYEIAFLHATFLGDDEKISKIDETYLNSDDAKKGDNEIVWRSFVEYRRILAGKGAVSFLRSLADDNNNCVDAWYYLAKSYSYYKENAKAATAYETAALASEADTARRVSLLGEAAVSSEHAGLGDQVSRIIREAKTLCLSTGLGDRALLEALRILAEFRGDEQIAAAVLERVVELDPSDVNSRFSLAYKHGDIGNNDLSLLHYTNIPAAERTKMTWNNLGVVRDQFSLPIKSVASYDRAKDKGETLAMSNIAFKLLSAGFLTEAQEQCDAALQIKGYHKNIGTAITRIKEAPEAEDKKEMEILKETEPKNSFYRNFGRAVAKLEPNKLAGKWQGPDCELQNRINGGEFEASGTYEKPVNSLLFALASLGSAGSKSERHQVMYKGSVTGRAIQASVTRSKDGDPPKTLLSAEADTKVLLFIADDATEFSAMEIASGSKPRFYSLRRVVSAE